MTWFILGNFYCCGLELNLQYPWGMPVITNHQVATARYQTKDLAHRTQWFFRYKMLFGFPSTQGQEWTTEQTGLRTHCSQKYMDLTVVNNHLPSPSFRISWMSADDGGPFPSKQGCADFVYWKSEEPQIPGQTHTLNNTAPVGKWGPENHLTSFLNVLLKWYNNSVIIILRS